MEKRRRTNVGAAGAQRWKTIEWRHARVDGHNAAEEIDRQGGGRPREYAGCSSRGPRPRKRARSHSLPLEVPPRNTTEEADGKVVRWPPTALPDLDIGLAGFPRWRSMSLSYPSNDLREHPSWSAAALCVSRVGARGAW